MWKESHTQQKSRLYIDLTKLKSMTEEDWSKIVHRIPFLGDIKSDYRDYRDNSNLKRTNYVFRPKTFKTAKESGLSLLRTLNFS